MVGRMLGGWVGAALRDAKANCCGREMAGDRGSRDVDVPSRTTSFRAPKFRVVSLGVSMKPRTFFLGEGGKGE